MGLLSLCEVVEQKPNFLKKLFKKFVYVHGRPFMTRCLFSFILFRPWLLSMLGSFCSIACPFGASFFLSWFWLCISDSTWNFPRLLWFLVLWIWRLFSSIISCGFLTFIGTTAIQFGKLLLFTFSLFGPLPSSLSLTTPLLKFFPGSVSALALSISLGLFLNNLFFCSFFLFCLDEDSYKSQKRKY